MNNMLAHAAATPLEDSTTRLIPLTQGQSAIVDAADFDWLNQWKWHARYFKKKDKWYALRTQTVSPFSLFMHRELMQVKKAESKIDHRDGNGLNNTRSNIRRATNSENLRNTKLYCTNTSGFKGVSQVKKTGRWKASIGIFNRGTKFLGNYLTKEEAAAVYNEAAKKYHGEFARLNQV